jgi:hypothetical protein
MKKRDAFTVRGWLAAVCILCVIAGAAAAQESHAPEWINELPPEDAFWGIGSAKMEDESLALEAAVSKAQWDVAAQVGTELRQIISEHVSEEGNLIRESYTRETIKPIPFGAVINAQERTADGTWWVRVSLQKADAREFINDAIGSEAADLKAQEALKLLDALMEKDQREP